MSLLTNNTDYVWAVKLKEGDCRAFEEIFHFYKTRLFYFILKYIPIEAEAEEIIQNAFLKLWEHRSKLDENKSIRNYLYTITVNMVYNQLKKRVLQDSYQMHLKDEVSEETEHEIFYDDLLERIEKLVIKLPPQQQRIFLMSRFEGLSNKEIAEQLNISVRTVENLIYRSLQFIKENIKDEVFIFLLFLLLLAQ